MAGLLNLVQIGGDQFAEMVNMPMRDENVGQFWQADGLVVLFGYGRYPRQQLLIRPFHARPRIHQNQAVAIIDDIDIRPQTRKSLHRKGIDVPAVIRSKFLDLVHGGFGDCRLGIV